MTLNLLVHRISSLTLVTACLAAVPAHAENYESWGVGYGMSYAYLGINVDYRVAPNIYLSGAAGTGISEFGLAAGARYYLLPSLFETARARMSVMYGPYAGLMHTPVGSSRRKEDFTGLAVGVGMVLFSENEGFDLDFYYTNTREAKHRFTGYDAAGEVVTRDGLDPLSISLGYRKRFQ